MSKTYSGSFTCLSQRVDSEQELVTGGLDGTIMFWDCDVIDAPVSVGGAARGGVVGAVLSPRVGALGVLGMCRHPGRCLNECVM